MTVCMLIPISTGQRPNRALEQTAWHFLIGPANPSLLCEAGIRKGLPAPREPALLTSVAMDGEA